MCRRPFRMSIRSRAGSAPGPRNRRRVVQEGRRAITGAVAHLPVSVVLPTWNRAALLPRAVASALAAMAPGDELIVADDGSTDATDRALAPWRDRLVHVRGPHAGAGATRNLGLSRARHPLVAFLDSDDEWDPAALAMRRAVVEARPDVVFAFSDLSSVDPRGVRVERNLRTWHGDPRPWSEILGPGVPFSSLAPGFQGREDFAVHVGRIYEAEMSRSYVSTITLLLRRDLAGEALRFPTDLPTFEDWEAIARMAGKGPVAYLDVTTATQHGHAGPRLTALEPLVGAEARLLLLSRVWGSDAEFLADPARRAAYEGVVREQHRIRARRLIALGRPKEAREAIRLAGGAPLSHRVLAHLPAPLLRLATGVRSLTRGGPGD